MRQSTVRIRSGLLWAALLMVATSVIGNEPVQAQDIPPQRQIRGYIPPDQLVSFRPETPFDQFVDFLNPIFQRVTGKMVIDPESRSQPIGVSISGMHFIDALELVLSYNGLTYRETDRFFVIEPAPPETQAQVQGVAGELQAAPVAATLDTREIQINAVLFSVNLTKARNIGIDWNVFFGGDRASGGGSGRVGTGGTGGFGQDGDGQQQGFGQIPRFFVRSDDLADAVDEFIIMPNQFDMATLTQFFRLLESEGAGEFVANPRVTVQSGESGRIQIGTDFPFVTRDFAGNTITQFVSTGIIIEVEPTLISQPIADTTGAPLVDFIHLNVRVENSNGQISNAGPIVDRSTATTQVLLLDGETTIIGGLYSTDEVVNRRGIPVLKDLPGWFFGIRYLTGVTQRTVIQRELLILLQAKLVDPLRARMDRPFDQDLLEQRRQQIRDVLRFLDQKASDEVVYPSVFEDR